MGATKSVASLHCGHTRIYEPTPCVGDILWCGDCLTYRKCIGIGTVWRVYCTGCALSVGYGSDISRARRTGVRHQRRNPGHQVSIWRNSVKVEDIPDVQEPLPIVTNPRPSREESYGRVPLVRAERGTKGVEMTLDECKIGQQFWLKHACEAPREWKVTQLAVKENGDFAYVLLVPVSGRFDLLKFTSLATLYSCVLTKVI
jgi:hypothetical protein